MSDNTTRSFGDTVAQTVSEEEFWNRKFDDEPPPVPRGVFHARPPSRFQRVLDRLHDWRSDTRFGVAALVAVAVIAGVVWYRIGVGGGASARSVAAPASSRVSPSTPTTRAEATPPTTTTSTNRITGHPITVHVAGAV
ncbi:MAG TPA: hypothetical protein VEP49_03570, partial [Acidimicrobiia bacterium]|nr:hypothetical protein [Acidimicrobiia bacterium]